MLNYLEVSSGCKPDAQTGRIVNGEPLYMSTKLFYRAHKWDKLEIKNGAFAMAVATYGDEIPEEYMYTYMYEQEQNWSSYKGDFSDDVFSQQDYVFEDDCWFRLCIKHIGGQPCSEEDAQQINRIVEYRSNFESLSDKDRTPSYFEEEINATADAVMKKVNEGKALVFCLLSDSHYTVNGTWQTTMKNIKAVNEKIGFNGIIHLGDLQDGMLDKGMCRRIANSCINDMRQINDKVYLTIGNHDTNYFKGNPEWLTTEEQYGIYGRFNDSYVRREGVNGYYYTDFDNVGMRMLVLTSFDHRQALRYGFSDEELKWVKETLAATPSGYKVLIISHDAPLAQLDYWASEIRNGDRLMDILEAYHRQEGKEILGYIHGHTHADYVYNERSFPIVSIGCSKVEYFPDKKPEGSTRYMRKLGDVTQELWDVLVVTPEKKRLDFIRFGAGMDRTVKPKVKVWAHRGASGYAPENTLEAFKLAADMGADGVELDVQLTKDGELVVVHDEYIDRVSDGHGRVVDYTLEELRQFNFNKMHPEYMPSCKIPTLREVLELLNNTRMTVNIELKTGVIFYPGIEKKVVELVHCMGWQDRILYSSFNHCSVMKVREYDSEARIAFLYAEQLSQVADYAVMNGVYSLNPSVLCTTLEDEMRRCREKNIQINVWTVNDEENMRRLNRMGVNSLITNYPDIAKKIVNE